MKKRTALEYLALAMLMSLGFGCVTYDQPAVRSEPTRHAAPPPQPTAVTRVVATQPLTNVSISDREQRIIRDYLHPLPDESKHGNKGKSLPPGLAKKTVRGRNLPPGWQNKLVKGEIMSPPVYAASEPLPAELTAHLPPPPAGTILVTIDGKIVRLMRATMEIVDVFDLGL